MKFIVVVFVLCLNSAFGQTFPECDASVVTWHAHPYSCTKYVLCFHGNPIERLCAPGLHFNWRLGQCMFPQLAQCENNNYCPDVDDELNPVFLPNPDDCASYFVCFKGFPIPRTCAENLWWDVTYTWCTVADEVVCDSRTPNNPNSPTPTLPPPTNPPPTNPPPTNPPPTIPQTTTPSTTTTTQNPNTMDCPTGSEPSFHPHSRDCSLYFICINGVAFLRECARGTIFDIIERKCYDKDLATCISGTIDDSDSRNEDFQPEAFSFVCPLHVQYEITHYPHQSKCNRYYLCNKGVAFLRNCPSGQFYDIENEICLDELDATCLNDL